MYTTKWGKHEQHVHNIVIINFCAIIFLEFFSLVILRELKQKKKEMCYQMFIWKLYGQTLISTRITRVSNVETIAECRFLQLVELFPGPLLRIFLK